eukprot:gene29557-55251_t
MQVICAVGSPDAVEQQADGARADNPASPDCAGAVACAFAAAAGGEPEGHALLRAMTRQLGDRLAGSAPLPALSTSLRAGWCGRTAAPPFAAGIDVRGAGDARVNGRYALCSAGAAVGAGPAARRWAHVDDPDLCVHSTGGAWRIGRPETLRAAVTDAYRATAACGPLPPLPASRWRPVAVGGAPAPVVELLYEGWPVGTAVDALPQPDGAWAVRLPDRAAEEEFRAGDVVCVRDDDDEEWAVATWAGKRGYRFRHVTRVRVGLEVLREDDDGTFVVHAPHRKRVGGVVDVSDGTVLKKEWRAVPG